MAGLGLGLSLRIDSRASTGSSGSSPDKWIINGSVTNA